jgi:hypothetical protein
VESTAIALGEEAGDELLLGTLLKTLPDVVREFQPQLVIYVAGTDGAADDSLGSWKMSADGMLRRDQFVVELVRRRGKTIPMVVVLGGGYGGRSWRYTARFAAWKMTGRTVEPPGNEQLLLQTFRRIERTLDQSSLTTEPDDAGWSLSEEDLAGILPEAPRHTRFLGYFSRHGVELVLQRFGILDQLRALGFNHPTVDVDLSHPVGQTVRIFGDVGRTELLMELRVNRTMRPIKGLDLMVVEWLLLQNPRAHFGPYRRPLPGQDYPGLGMLKDVFGWLVVISERLELDGIYFVPSSYHVAAQSRGVVNFVEPEHEAIYRAFKKALEGMQLAEASQAVDRGRVVDRSTGEAREWRGLPMILPVSDELKDRIHSDTYEAEVLEALENLDFELVES